LARIAGVNLPNQKRLEIGLTYIYGIGEPTARKVAIALGLNPDTKNPNYDSPGHGPELQPGMTFAIQPMINAGAPDVYLHDDEWSISTIDGSLSAHFEHTVAVTDEGPKILTVTPNPAETVLLP